MVDSLEGEWTDSEEEYLKGNYKEKTAKEIAETLSRSRESVYNKARNLGIKSGRAGPGQKWTEKEREFLKENIDKKTPKEIGEELGRSKHSVFRKRKELGLETPFVGIGRGWTDEEIDYLVENYDEKTAEEIGDELNRSIDSVQGKVKNLGLDTKRVGSGKEWTEREEDFLKSNYEDMTAHEIANELDRTFHSVVEKGENLGLSFREVDFDDEPSPNLAYVLGVIEGDGCVFEGDNEYRVILSVKDKEFAESFRNALTNIGLNPLMRTVANQGKNEIQMYRVQASSKIFVKWYQELNLEYIKKYLETDEMKKGFIRGFYESEGTLSIDKRKNRCFSIKIANIDEKLMKFVKNILVELEFSPSSLGEKEHNWDDRSWLMYHLRVGGSDEAERFLKEIGSVIPRKSLSRI